MLLRNLFIFSLLLLCFSAYSQQDVDFHLNAHLLTGQKILKVKRDFHDIYLWVLGQNNTVYRVNSVTLAVDDYTAKFAAYNYLQFVDIMGHSADTVFVATNSTNVIEWANGNFRVIGSADGIPATVNSLGIYLGINSNYGRDNGKIIVATKKGIRSFDPNTQTIGFFPDTGFDAGNTAIAEGYVFESSYRNLAMEDSTSGDASGGNSPALQYLPVQFNGSMIYGSEGPIIVGDVFEQSAVFGNHVNTVIALNDGFGRTDGVFANFFWGTENGMFRNEVNNSYWIDVAPWSQYLNGIKVNKITEIKGLTSFSAFNYNGLLKQNLLVGTDIGFYFSNSIYDPTSYFTGDFSLFHDDDLGNTIINDICVNAVPDAKPICENGVWLAAADGLYLLKPDYGKYLSNQQQKLIAFSNQPDSLSQIQVCALSPLTANVNDSYNSIQWYKDGVELPAQSKDTLVITAAGDYNAVIYDPCEAIHIESNHLKVNVISASVFTFNYPDTIKQCSNNPDTLQTTYNPGYRYRWYTNDVLNSDTTSSFIVAQTGRYKVEVSACTNTWVPSKEVQVDMITLPLPQITAGKAIYCAEDTAALSVNVPTDGSYTINWYLNGSLLANNSNLTTIKTTTAGSYTVTINSTASVCAQASPAFQLVFTPAPVYTFNYPSQLQYCAGTTVPLQVTASTGYQYRWYSNDVLNGDTTASFVVSKTGSYKVEVSACAGSWLPSKEVQVNSIQLPVPLINTDKTAYCIGDNATLSVALPADSSYTINWYRDSVLIENNTNLNSLTTSTPGNYSVSVVYNTANTDGTICSQTSAVQPIIFNPPPSAGIQKIVKTTLCAGQTVELLAQYTGGTVQWSTGETADQISVGTSGTYTLTVTSPAGCKADTSISVNFFTDPVLNVHDTTICTYKGQPVTLTAPPGYVQYTWNGVTGSQAYSVSLPQTVTLMVTDTNGCQAAQQIVVTDQCPDIWVPNTFTPNGDGINDTWIIEGINGDVTVLLKVFTRYGNLVYESKGYGTPWNGTFGARKLPPGVYYYTLTARNNTQKFSGSVSIIY